MRSTSLAMIGLACLLSAAVAQDAVPTPAANVASSDETFPADAAHAASAVRVLHLWEVLNNCSLIRWMAPKPQRGPLESAWGAHEAWGAWSRERAQFELALLQKGRPTSPRANGSPARAEGFDDLLDAELPERWQLAFAPWGEIEPARFTLQGLAPADTQSAWLEFDPESNTAILLDPTGMTVLAFDVKGRLRWSHQLPRSISLFDNPVRRPPGYSRESEWNAQTYWQLQQHWEYPTIDLRKAANGRVRYELEYSWARFRIDVRTGFLECIPRRGNVPQLQQRAE
ncbi:MAG: hypothetical protein JSR82_19115 [Verrucomicrobia bacterium]|nr:hypothetical protein [Verrucomicrobiota bacterium]